MLDHYIGSLAARQGQFSRTQPDRDGGGPHQGVSPTVLAFSIKQR